MENREQKRLNNEASNHRMPEVLASMSTKQKEMLAMYAMLYQGSGVSKMSRMQMRQTLPFNDLQIDAANEKEYRT